MIAPAIADTHGVSVIPMRNTGTYAAAGITNSGAARKGEATGLAAQESACGSGPVRLQHSKEVLSCKVVNREGSATSK